MRIIEICLAPSLGGLELYFEKCCLWFHKSPHTAICIVKKESRLEGRLVNASIPVSILSSPSKWMSIFNAYKLANIIENNNVDIVHVHHKDDLLLTALTKIISKKKFLLVHSRQMQIPHSKKDPWHKFIYKKIDLFLTITEKLKADAIKNIPLDPQRIKNLYYGVKAPTNYDPKNCFPFFKMDAADPKKFKIGIFSRLEYLKGQHLVVHAAHMLQSAYPDLIYYFIGDSMSKDYLMKLKASIKEYKLEGTILFKGFHPNPLEIMPAFDLILLPSYNETFGLVLAEAMRAGVAVVGTDAGGVTEIIDHKTTGLLFKKDDAKDLANQIALLYNDEPLRKLLAKNGKEKADAVFDEEVHFYKFEEILESEILNKKVKS
ncbi:MAG: glycosyltransferase family 4 protein [Bacteroidota bacterium]|nr:glycosyltransferase family 4 protein [Bacteroidota bacterium]